MTFSANAGFTRQRPKQRRFFSLNSQFDDKCISQFFALRYIGNALIDAKKVNVNFNATCCFHTKTTLLSFKNETDLVDNQRINRHKFDPQLFAFRLVSSKLVILSISKTSLENITESSTLAPLIQIRAIHQMTAIRQRSQGVYRFLIQFIYFTVRICL